MVKKFFFDEVVGFYAEKRQFKSKFWKTMIDFHGIFALFSEFPEASKNTGKSSLLTQLSVEKNRKKKHSAKKKLRKKNCVTLVLRNVNLVTKFSLLYLTSIYNISGRID